MSKVLDNLPLIREYSGSSSGVANFPWTINGRFFNDSKGQIVRRKGFSSFNLLDKYSKGIDINPILNQYSTANLARVFLYTPVKDWGSSAWDIPSSEATIDFCHHMSDKGYQVGLTLATDNDNSKINQIKNLVNSLKGNDIINLQLEAVNEPYVKGDDDKIDPSEFKNLLSNSGFLFTSGIYNDNKRFWGQFWLDHSSRDSEWFRKGGHNLKDAWDGSGPNFPDEPKLHIPGAEDEPVKPSDIGFDTLGLYAYAASCGLMGAGATFHSESGKLSLLLSPQEEACKNMFFAGLDMFPLDSADGVYRRIDEVGAPEYARTYVVGNNSIRIKQVTSNHPESGWKNLDDYGICWTR